MVLYMGLMSLALPAFRGGSILRNQICNTDYHPQYQIKVSIQRL